MENLLNYVIIEIGVYMKKISILFLLIFFPVFLYSQELNQWQKNYDKNDWGEDTESYQYSIWEEAYEVKENVNCIMGFSMWNNWSAVTLIIPGDKSYYAPLLYEENKVVKITFRNKQKEDTIEALVWNIYAYGKNTGIDIVPLRTGTVKTSEPLHGFRDIFKMFLTNNSFDMLVKTNFFTIRSTFSGINLNNDNKEIYLLMSVLAPYIKGVEAVFKLDKNLLYTKRETPILLSVDWFSRLHTYTFLTNQWLDNTDERDAILKMLKENGLDQVRDPIDDDAPIFYQY